MIDYTLASTCTNTSFAPCTVYAHQNRLGSVVATTDSAGDKLDTYTYSPYGESGPEGNTGFPFRFTGQKLDATTGLYYYKARFYDTQTGRFLQTDPIGYEDQMNLYAYVGNDPVNAWDPSGMDSTSCTSFGSDMRCGIRRDETGDSISFDNGPEIGLGGVDNNFSVEHWAQLIAYVAHREGIEYSTGKVAEFALTGQQRDDMIAVTAISFAAIGARGSASSAGRAGQTPTRPPRNPNQNPASGEIVGSAQKGDAYHRSAAWYRAQALESTPKKFRGGDGRTYYEYKTSGTLNGKQGTYNYIYDDAGNLTHQKFNPGP